MKRLIIPILLIILLVIGCSQQETESKQTTDPITKEPTGTETEQQTKEAPEEPAETKEPKPEKCTSDINQDDITRIDLSAFAEGLKITEDGFSFRVIPIDFNNNTVPATGNVGLTIFSTKWLNGELVKSREIYKKSIYLKKEEVSPDCSSKEIFINFNDIKKQQNYRYVTEDDPGYLRIEFKRAYSTYPFEIEYLPFEHGEDIMP